MATPVKSPLERDVLHWRDTELRHAHNVWREYGLTEDAPKDVRVQHVYNMYRNSSWDGGWGGIPASNLIEVPMMFSLVNTLMAKLFARHPQVDVTSENPEGKKAARRMEVLQNFLIRKRDLGMKRQINRALLGAMLTPFGAVRHGFTPQEEMFEGKTRISTRTSDFPDVPWIRAIDAPYLRMDPLADSFHPDDGARWCAFYAPMTMRQIERNPKLIKRRDLTPTRRAKSILPRPKELKDEELASELEIVDTWTIYNGEDRTWLTVTEGSSKPIREEAEWPIAWRRLPVNVFGFNPQMDTPFHIAPAAIIAKLCRERNKIRTLMMELVKRMRRIVLLNDTVINEDDMMKLTGNVPEFMEFIRASADVTAAIHEVSIGGDPSQLLSIDARIEEDARLALGQSLLDRGQRINVESATESADVQAGSDLQAGRNASPFEDAMSDIFATHGQALQSPGVLVDQLSVPILGEIASDELFSDLEEQRGPFLQIDPQDNQLAGAFIHEVRPGSAAPRNPNEEVRMALANLEVAGTWPDQTNTSQALSDYWTAADKDPQRMVTEKPVATEVGEETAGLPGNGVDRSVANALQGLAGTRQ